jgi:hypothetical protein
LIAVDTFEYKSLRAGSATVFHSSFEQHAAQSGRNAPCHRGGRHPRNLVLCSLDGLAEQLPFSYRVFIVSRKSTELACTAAKLHVLVLMARLMTMIQLDDEHYRTMVDMPQPDTASATTRRQQPQYFFGFLDGADVWLPY